MNKKDVYFDTDISDFSLYGISDYTAEGFGTLANKFSRYDVDLEKFKVLLPKNMQKNKKRVGVEKFYLDFFLTPNTFGNEPSARKGVYVEQDSQVNQYGREMTDISDFAENTRAFNFGSKLYKLRYKYGPYDQLMTNAEINVQDVDRRPTHIDPTEPEAEGYEYGLWDTDSFADQVNIKKYDAYIDYWKRLSTCEELEFTGSKLKTTFDKSKMLTFNSESDNYRDNFFKIGSAEWLKTGAPVSSNLVEYQDGKVNQNFISGLDNKLVYLRKNELNNLNYVTSGGEHPFKAGEFSDKTSTEFLHGFEDYLASDFDSVVNSTRESLRKNYSISDNT